MTRSSRPASRTRATATSCCSLEIVVVVTRQPRVLAAYTAKPPQPVPISTTWSPAAMSSFSQTSSSLAIDASSSVESRDSKTPQEYIIVGSSIRSKRSLPRS